MIGNSHFYLRKHFSWVVAILFILNSTLVPKKALASSCTQNVYDSGHKLIFDNIRKTMNILLPPQVQYDLIAYLNEELDGPINGKLMQIMQIDQDEISSYPSNIQNVLNIITSVNLETDSRLIQLANSYLDSIRYYSTNLGMGDCYKVVVLDVENEFKWAFSMGCTIYLSSGLIKKLSPDQAKSIIAHEMVHGAEGHMVKLLANYADSASMTIETLIFEDMQYMFSGGKAPPCMKQYLLSNNSTESLVKFLSPNFDMFIDIHGANAPDTELMADIGAVKILKRAKIDPKNLITGILALFDENIDAEELKSIIANETDSFRDYPSLNTRFAAIRQEMSK